jgi:hypothetical protein
MILTKEVLSAIKVTIDKLGYSNFLNLAPQTTVYPFITFNVISVPTEYTFSEVKENIHVQITIFDDERDVNTILNMASAVETAFENYNTSKIFCTHKLNEIGPTYNNKENYFQHIIDYEFRTQRNKV